MFPALLQSLDSLDTVEHQRPVFAQSLRPRIGLEKRVPEFLEDVLRGDRKLEGLEILLQRVPRSAAENLISRFNRTSSRAEMQRLVDLARAVGADERLDEGSVRHAYEVLKPMDAVIRQPNVFGPKLESPPGADLQTEFLYFLGRRA